MTKPMNKIDLPAAPTAQVGKLIEELCPQGVENQRGQILNINYCPIKLSLEVLIAIKNGDIIEVKS